MIRLKMNKLPITLLGRPIVYGEDLEDPPIHDIVFGDFSSYIVPIATITLKIKDRGKESDDTI